MKKISLVPFGGLSIWTLVLLLQLAFGHLGAQAAAGAVNFDVIGGVPDISNGLETPFQPVSGKVRAAAVNPGTTVPQWSHAGYTILSVTNVQGDRNRIMNQMVDQGWIPYLPGFHVGDLAVTNTAAGQVGKRLAFAATVVDLTNKFNMHQTQVTRVSSDPAGVFNERGASLAGLGYDLSRIGWSFGPDGIPNTGDDRWYHSGESGTNMVNVLYYVSPGIGFDATAPGAFENAVKYFGEFEIATTLRVLLPTGGVQVETGTYSINNVELVPPTLTLVSKGANDVVLKVEGKPHSHVLVMHTSKLPFWTADVNYHYVRIGETGSVTITVHVNSEELMGFFLAEPLKLIQD
jgi:hypothetical protein